MRPIIAFIATSLSLAVLAFSAATPAVAGDPYIHIRNASGNEMLVTAHVLLPALYQEKWAEPGQVVTFAPGPMAWKGVLYISVRASHGPGIDKNSPHICLSSRPIKGNSGNSYTAHYNRPDCSISQD